MRCKIEYLENRLLASSAPPGAQVLIQGPDHVTAGRTLASIRVVVDSSDFQLVKSDNNPVELILDTGLGQTQSLGTETLKSGKAVFRHIRLTQAGGYTLEAITDGATTSPTPFGVMPGPVAVATLESSNYDPNTGFVQIDIRIKDKFGNTATNDNSVLFLGPTQPLHAPVKMPIIFPSGNPVQDVTVEHGRTEATTDGTGLFGFYLENTGPTGQSASVKMMFSNHRLKPIWSPQIPGIIQTT